MEKADILKMEATSIITQDLFLRYKNKSATFEQYDRVYPFATEALAKYINDLEGKKVLSIASSGDHAIESYYKGAEKVDTFDINKFTKYYQELKVAALKLLEYDEFMYLFNNENCKKDELLALLNKLREQLSYETYELFYYIINRFVFYSGLLENHLFFSRPDHFELSQRCSYGDPYKYYEVKKAISDKSVNYINSPLSEITTHLTDSYDVIYLSNVTSYAHDIEKAVEDLRKLLEFLNEDGRLYFAYLYGDDNTRIHPLYQSLGEIVTDYVPSVMDESYSDSYHYIKK